MKEASHKRPHIIWLHLYEVSRRGKFIETEIRFEVTRGWGRKRGELLLSGHRASVQYNEAVLEINKLWYFSYMSIFKKRKEQGTSLVAQWIGPANAGETGSSPVPGGFHMPHGNWVHALQPLKALHLHCSTAREATIIGSQHPTIRE